MSNWLDRSGYVTLYAFLGGAAVTTIIALLVIFLRSGGDDDEPQTVPPTITAVAATATALATVPIVTGTPPPTTPTPAITSQTVDDAVAAFVQDELGGVYIGECPPAAPSGEQIEGICSVELYRSTELATFNIGPFGSEALGEAVVLPDADGVWSLTFFEFPALDAQITVGGSAMVFQAEDCLNFRAEPTAASDVLSCQIDGTRSRVQDGPLEADGITWWLLEDFGWASASFLAPVQ
jgi:hypothetical protein